MENRALYKNLTVLIVEDDQTTRETLKSMVELEFKYVYEAQNGCEGEELFHKYRPDVVLTDIEMPCMTGLEMLEQIRKGQSDAVFIFISAYSDVEKLLEAIDLKADGYIIKPILYGDLMQKIDANLRQLKAGEQLYELLSKREYEVFIDLAKGIKSSDIALKYDLKPKTVGTYRKRILEKLHMNSNAQLITYAITHRLI